MKNDGVNLPKLSSSNWHRPLHLAVWGENILQAILSIIACIPVFITLSIIVVLIYETVIFFQKVPLLRFLTDTNWTPLFPNPSFGILVIASGTLLITAIAMTVAIPIGLLIAIYLSEFAPPAVRYLIKPGIETLAGIPTVVYGYFALLFVTPLLQQFIPNLAGFNALSAGLVTGVMIMPIISSLSEDALHNVPYKLREGAYALGFTKREVITKIVLPTAFPGIIASFTLAASRSLGETLIAAIASGQTPQLSLNPLESTETMTAFIIQASLGDVRFGSVEFNAIFTVGMVLFSITLLLNTLSYWLVRRHRKQMSEVVVFPTEFSPKNIVKNDYPTISKSDNQILLKKNLVFQSSFHNRHWQDNIFQLLTLLATLCGLVVLAVLFLDVCQDGLSRLNWQFITNFASRKPEEAGILAALLGTLWLLVLTALFATPIGVGAAVYLEEYLPDNLFSKLLEVNIANLAALPSIIYGLLGLQLFVRILGFITGKTSLLSAALTLSAIALPLLIIATRAALRAIPDSLRQGGYAAGMTRGQVLFYLVLPSAMPRILTGTFLSLSRAIGETAPLIALGAAAFIAFAPPLSIEALQSPFTALPVQIFNWASRPQQAFHVNAAAAIIVLVGILFFMNIFAIILRDRNRR